MHIDDFHVARARTIGDASKEKLLDTWNFQQGEIFAGRSNENQIVVFCVVQREQAAPFNTKRLVQSGKDKVEIVHGKDFAYASIVVENRRFPVFFGVVIAHAGVGTAYESGVTEDD